MIVKDKVVITNPGGIYTNCRVAFEYNKKDSTGYKINDYALSSKDLEYLRKNGINSFYLLSDVTNKWKRLGKRELFYNFPWLYGWEYEWTGRKREDSIEEVVCLRKYVDGELRRIIMDPDFIKFEHPVWETNNIWC